MKTIILNPERENTECREEQKVSYTAPSAMLLNEKSPQHSTRQLQLYPQQQSGDASSIASFIDIETRGIHTRVRRIV